jgi:hypothetical protein
MNGYDEIRERQERRRIVAKNLGFANKAVEEMYNDVEFMLNSHASLLAIKEAAKAVYLNAEKYSSPNHYKVSWQDIEELGAQLAALNNAQEQ